MANSKSKSTSSSPTEVVSQQMKAAKGFVYISPKPASAKAEKAILESISNKKAKVAVKDKAAAETKPVVEKAKATAKIAPKAPVIKSQIKAKVETVKVSRAQQQQEKKAAAVSAIAVELNTCMKQINAWARRMKMGQDVQSELANETWTAMTQVHALFALVKD